MRGIIAAIIAILTLTDAATAAPMHTPPWWYPTWGTWVEGDNIKICARISFNASMAIVTVTNTDRTAISFSLRANPGVPDGLLNPDPKGFFDLLRDACDRARDHEKEGWEARWYKISIGPTANHTVGITNLQGSLRGGPLPWFIQEVTVPTGTESP